MTRESQMRSTLLLALTACLASCSFSPAATSHPAAQSDSCCTTVSDGCTVTPTGVACPVAAAACGARFLSGPPCPTQLPVRTCLEPGGIVFITTGPCPVNG